MNCVRDAGGKGKGKEKEKGEGRGKEKGNITSNVVLSEKSRSH